MKTYPTIPREVRKGTTCYVFDKLDGSQIRVEWSRKRGFYKYGTRRRLLGEDDPLLGEAHALFVRKYADDLGAVFKKQRWDKAVAFCEFWGEHSFAGSHQPDEPHTVTLLDVSYAKKGLLSPKDFLKLFGHLDVAKLLYHGNVNEEAIREVQQGELEGMTFEGVVCKSTQFASPGRPVMFKIKNLAWIQRLKDFCKGDEKRFQELL